jgi:hypothetical protein
LADECEAFSGKLSGTIEPTLFIVRRYQAFGPRCLDYFEADLKLA